MVAAMQGEKSLKWLMITNRRNTALSLASFRHEMCYWIMAYSESHHDIDLLCCVTCTLYNGGMCDAWMGTGKR